MPRAGTTRFSRSRSAKPPFNAGVQRIPDCELPNPESGNTRSPRFHWVTKDTRLIPDRRLYP